MFGKYFMQVAITGHTGGIGKEIYQYFQNKNYNCIGFSRSNGYDISNLTARMEIAELSKNCDIFVNNAYCNFDDSQLDMLMKMTNLFSNQEKIIINISTRATIFDHNTEKLNLYKESKLKIDKFCETKLRNPWIINLKPGLTDTPRVGKIPGEKMPVTCISSVINFILDKENLFRISSITFGY